MDAAQTHSHTSGSHDSHHHDHDEHHDHSGHEDHGGHGGHDHSGHVELFRRLFWWNLVLAVPVIAFNSMFAMLVG